MGSSLLTVGPGARLAGDGTVGTLAVSDPDAGDSHTWSVGDERFEIVDGALKLKSGIGLAGALIAAPVLAQPRPTPIG